MADISILDGGLGQEIQKRSKNEPHPLWSVKVMFDHPEIVLQVHKDFITCGARVICLNTYAATKTRMTRHGFGSKLEEAHKTAIKLAKQSLNLSSLKDYSIQIAGCLPPLVASYVSKVSLDFNNSLEEYRELVALQKNDIDLFLIETISNIEEARAGIIAVKEVNKPVFISLTLKDDLSNELRSGEKLSFALDEISKELPNGIMINCSSPEAISSAMPTMSKLEIPFGGYANGFTSIDALTPGSTVDKLTARKNLSPAVYAKFAFQWIDNGATILGFFRFPLLKSFTALMTSL